jgi:5-methylcytosine-specific restriction endonuclease McrA
VAWDEWITLPVRDGDYAVHTTRGAIRVPTVIVAVNYARVPKKRPKLCARAIRERDGNRCQYTGALLRPDEGSLDHVVPRSRGGPDTWENLVWSSRQVNTRKGNRLPHEAGLKLLHEPRAPKELPVTALLRNAHGIAEWKLFLNDKAQP